MTYPLSKIKFFVGERGCPAPPSPARRFFPAPPCKKHPPPPPAPTPAPQPSSQRAPKLYIIQTIHNARYAPSNVDNVAFSIATDCIGWRVAGARPVASGRGVLCFLSTLAESGAASHKSALFARFCVLPPFCPLSKTPATPQNPPIFTPFTPFTLIYINRTGKTKII